MTVRGRLLIRRAVVPVSLGLAVSLVGSATGYCPRITNVALGDKRVEIAWTMGQDERTLPDFGGYRVWMRDVWRVDDFELAREFIFGLDDTAAVGYWPFEPFYEDSIRVLALTSVQNAFPYEFSVTAFTESDPESVDQECLRANADKYGIVYPNQGPQNVLAGIKAIPNPYRSGAAWEFGGERRVTFIGLPNKATIRIYTTAVDHVRTLEHGDGKNEEGDLEFWNLKNADGEEIAPGVYIWHVDAPAGTIDGKIMIIK